MEQWSEMNDLKKENKYLREQFYGQQVNRRQSIIQDLIRIGTPADAAIADAEKLCSFIESDVTTAKNTKIKKTKKRGAPASDKRFLAAVAKDVYGKPKKKRKYQKKSLFWSKKKK